MPTRTAFSPHVVLATFGTHGDLHPFLALAMALQQRGARVTLAAAPQYREKIEAEAIDFASMRPDMQAVFTRLGMDERAITRAIARRPQFLLTHIVMPALRETYEDIMAVTGDADALVTHSVAYGAKLAAEKRGLPDFSVALQPMVFWSAFDPPVVANTPRLSRWIYRRGPASARAFIGLGKWVARRWARPIDTLRREIGMAPAKRHPLFEGQFSGNGVLALFSPHFGASQPDHPAHTAIVGFAFQDREAGAPAELSEALRQFLTAGSAPIVFTQGTSAVHDADTFVRESLAAVRTLGTRALLVLDEVRAEQWAAQASDRVMITGYAPYARVFPGASVIVHHGGIGTTAQALRAGRPQLLVPHLVDQPDNAARVARLGAGRVLSRLAYREARVVEALRELVQQPVYARRAQWLGQQVAAEDGAAAAADIILRELLPDLHD
jgi:rhamnosyltransferase subunit B